MNSILIVAGESSGEKYGAELVREFRTLHPSARFFGIGGKHMAAQGVDILFPVERLSVMGLFEVVSHIPRIRRLFRRLAREAIARKPSAAVLIDSPDFNLRLARRLKKAGIPVLYYVSPTVWAWRKGRLKSIRKSVARMMLIFPFEEAIYKSAGIPAAYIGHPLLERVKADLGRADFFARYGFDPEKKLVVLLPGSRQTEMRFHAPVLAEAIASMRQSLPVQFALILADSLEKKELEKTPLAHCEGLTILDRDGYNAMAAADVVLSACGTATLESALLGTPIVAFYRVSPLTYHAGRRLVAIKHYSIVNILAGKTVIPELIQKDFTAANISREAIRILESADIRTGMKEEFQRIRVRLGEGRASRNAARELDGFIGNDSSPS